MMGTTGTSYGGAWHTYGVRWAPGVLETYVDGVKGPVIAHSQVPSGPMFLILNPVSYTHLDVYKRQLVFRDEFDGPELGRAWTPLRGTPGNRYGGPFNPTKAVSYTHLDVYKRQWPTCPGSGSST